MLKNAVGGCVRSFDHLLWPSVCMNCRTPIAQASDRLCQGCWDNLLTATAGFYCRRCGKDTTQAAIVNGNCSDCTEHEFYFESILRCGVYADTLKNMILAFKNTHCEFAGPLAEMAQAVLDGSGLAGKLDYLVPVPLHWIRYLRRGYNQSLLIAKKLRSKGVKINTDLVRIRNTPTQTIMATPTQRARNVEGAFAVRKGHKFAGKSVCLVDDIKTTGATLNECAKTLKEAGAVNVYTVVLAVAGQR